MMMIVELSFIPDSYLKGLKNNGIFYTDPNDIKRYDNTQEQCEHQRNHRLKLILSGEFHRIHAR